MVMTKAEKEAQAAILAEANERTLQAEQRLGASLNTIEALQSRLFELEMEIVDLKAQQIAMGRTVQAAEMLVRPPGVETD